MSKTTACPLDCYDACSIEFKDGKITPVKEGYTNGFLCPHLNHYTEFETIKKPRFNGKEISMNEALEILKGMLQEAMPSKTLHYRGSGNFGLMQEVTDHFFASYGAVLTDGSLCDGAGEAGIVEGRGSNAMLTPEDIAKSDVVIFWGRNPHTTSSHLLPLLKEKTIIVIDPVKTQIAKEADLHIQLKPHGDYALAMLLCRFLHIHGDSAEEYMKEYAPEYQDFYEITQTIRIKATVDEIDVSLGDIGELLAYVTGKKVAIVVGVGVQKYADGADIMRAIDAFGVFLGLFGKEGSGVAYLGNSKEGITSPFHTKARRVSKVDTLFANYNTVFIQDANPLSQMPNTNRVKLSLEKVKNIVYFGLHENATSQMASLVIPAKSFLYKNDIRTSYSHHAMLEMLQVAQSENGISEYDLAKYLCEAFNIELQEEKFYIEYFKSFVQKNSEGILEVKNRKKQTIEDEFEFLDEYDNDFNMSDDYFLITPKSKKSLNSQFNVETNVYLHPSLGFAEGESVKITSIAGEAEFVVKHKEELRKDCVLIYSATDGVNNLTTSKHSYEGKSAIYQELKVKITKI